MKYDREWFVEWASSLLAGGMLTIGLWLLGAPPWAVVGFGALAFYVFRATDKLKVRSN